MKIKHALLTALLAVACGNAFAEKTEYQIDPTHTMVIASWSHMGFSNPMANFADATGKLVYDRENPAASTVQVEIPMQSLTSFVPALDTELKGKDYFNVEQFPKAVFTSTAVKAVGESRLEVQGNLQLRGVTRPVTLNVVLNGQGEHPMKKVPAIGFDATGSFKRSEFGIDKYIPAISDDIQLRITVEAHADKK
ncbi:polyisoprenoid-binding protein [Lysobacteraceae bacterium NML120232]|nr:polyisoprenoid-binding protein [Xanthomonadaceae bacterium NML08-0793]PJK12726.1 polyisoprenoid-binding protein [Xanthomonadaceae bacterium NML120232]